MEKGFRRQNPIETKLKHRDNAKGRQSWKFKYKFLVPFVFFSVVIFLCKFTAILNFDFCFLTSFPMSRKHTRQIWPFRNRPELGVLLYL